VRHSGLRERDRTIGAAPRRVGGLLEWAIPGTTALNPGAGRPP
jgi:hypothetical protein